MKKVKTNHIKLSQIHNKRSLRELNRVSATEYTTEAGHVAKLRQRNGIKGWEVRCPDGLVRWTPGRTLSQLRNVFHLR